MLGRVFKLCGFSGSHFWSISEFEVLDYLGNHILKIDLLRVETWSVPVFTGFSFVLLGRMNEGV